MLSNIWGQQNSDMTAPPGRNNGQARFGTVPEGPAASMMPAPSPLLTALGQDQQPAGISQQPTGGASPLLGALAAPPQNQVAPQAGGVWNGAAGWTQPGYTPPTQQQQAAHGAAMNRPGRR